ncbi:flagellar hook-associated protein FlgK [Terrarubrum flagellatum]|uniref:flagellar hook-associated protein FlgK n=1 Tax=Terrirubrum flagellatum TaxID=2895980 RepID=UPI0031456357
MSLSGIRTIAYSSLSASQYQISVASSNVANADTTGYTKKSATQTSVNYGSSGSGVAIASVSSNVSKYLLSDLAEATTTLGAATVTNDFADRLQSLFGSISSDSSSGDSLSSGIADLESALSSLASTPESDTLKAQVVDALDTVASQLRETSSSIQSLRADADGQIEDGVQAANDALNAIAELNTQIASAQARGESTSALEDQRNTALQTLSEQMNVSYYVNSDNQMRVYASTGTTLVDSKAHELSYSSATLVTADTVFDAITVDGNDVTGAITSGKIGALIEQRDETLPAAQDELDELASGLIEALNAVSNSGSSIPAPTTLIGPVIVSASDTLSATGTARIAVTDSSGVLVSYQDLDLSSYSTVGDLVDAIDSIDGLSASINASGQLTISSDSSANGVSIGDIDDSIGSSGEGLSNYFGLNDLLTGTNASDISVRKDILADSSLMPTASLSSDSALAVGDAALTEGDSTIAQALGDALAGDYSFAAAGGLGSTKSSFADYAGDIISTAASSATSASSALTTKETAKQTLDDSFSSATGVNLDEETALISELQQQYSTAAQLLQVVNDMFDALLSAAQS